MPPLSEDILNQEGKRLKNKFEIRGKETAIFIKRKDGTVLETLISTEDLERVDSMPGSWTVSWSDFTQSFYVLAYLGTYNGKAKNCSLHRWILNPPAGYVVDHINHDTLNNCRSNLRIVTPSQNQVNRRVPKNNKTSGVCGVYWNKRQQKWHARIQYQGKRKHLGMFDDIKEAETAVREARKYYMNDERKEA